ncbi:MAG: hypothetical protein A2V83_11180 [Nitrospirae bacterium RBG_16_64_22]|nr:MAG: hypothetical protein A2V83_11180 [Nitrospirae bacterium RBG_16_64_22]
MELKHTIEIWREGQWFLARTAELDFIAQGRTLEEAKANLEEVVRIQIREMKEMGTLEEYLSECGFEVRGDQIVPLREVVGFEKATALIG